MGTKPTCWIDGALCFEDNKKILGVLDAGICENCSKIQLNSARIINFFESLNISYNFDFQEPYTDDDEVFDERDS